MIRSFGCEETAAVFRMEVSRRFPQEIQRPARRKLLILDAATTLADLGDVPGNRLEKLRGDRDGQWSIRVNDQWRICFRWNDGDADAVEITDYH